MVIQWAQRHFSRSEAKHFICRAAAMLVVVAGFVSTPISLASSGDIVMSNTTMSDTAITAMSNQGVDITFHRQEESQRWYTVNDTVMGGVSLSQFAVSPARGQGLFVGELSLENNGGFASVRRKTNELEAVPYPLKKVSIRVKGDGRTYQFRLRTTSSWGGIAYAASFSTQADKWVQVVLSESDFTPRFRGRSVKAPDLRFNQVRQLGFMLADKQPGDFRLLIDAIQFE